MNSYFLIIIGVVIVLAVLYKVGRGKMDDNVASVEKVADLMEQEQRSEFFGAVAYQGGLPQIPKPCYINLGIANDGLVIYNKDAFAAKMDAKDCNKVEKFSIKSKAGKFMKSTVLLGPLVPMLFKDKIRHFVTVEYFDSNQEENNLLLELKDKVLQEKLFEQISVVVGSNNSKKTR